MTKLKASPYTQLFWIEYCLDPSRTDYNLVFDQTIHGELSRTQLSLALCNMIQDHILFNSHLIEEDSQLFWQTNAEIALLEEMDDTEDNRLSFVNKPFHLTEGPLYRFGLFKKNQQESRFIVVVHHALMDGRAFVAFTDLVSQYYHHTACHLSLEKQDSSIRALNDRLSSMVSECEAQGSQKIWLDYFEDLDLTNELHYTKVSSTDKPCLGELTFNVDKSILVPLLQEGTYTSFQILSIVWGVLIAKHNASNRSFITYPIGIKEADSLIYGGQINTLVLKTMFNRDDRWLDLLERNRLFIKSLRDSSGCKPSYLPTYNLLSLSANKQLDIGFAQTALKNDNCQFKFKDCTTDINHNYNLDMGGSVLVLKYEEGESDYSFKINYRADLFTRKYMEDIQRQYLHLISALVVNPSQLVSSTTLLAHDVYKQVIYDWNKTDVDYPRDKTIHQWFEEQTARTPNNIAIVFEGESLTYQSLNQKANQVARLIRQHYQTQYEELTPGALIVLCLDRSLEMMIAILGVLKAGGAYVPIEPSYPEERIQYMLQDTNSCLLLTQLHLAEPLQRVVNATFLNQCAKSNDTHLIVLDDAGYQHHDNTNLSQHSDATDLAYVIYTSGTTGLPKGVMIAHNGVVNYIEAQRGYLDYQGIQRFYMLHSYAFDTSVSSIFGALLMGNTLVFTSEKKRLDSENFHQYHIDIAYLPPAYLNTLDMRDVSGLKTVVISGEVPDGDKLSNLTMRIINEYGPTEGTVCSTYSWVDRKNFTCIGRPISNKRVYVLDEDGNPVPEGIVGELYIGGVGLARGYLNRPELTAERFIENPFATEEDKAQGYTKLYKTGDLVRWLPEGNIEIIGRNDFQVKIRGFRIELGEIEHVLTAQGSIKQSLVLAKERQTSAGTTKYLAAYYISDLAIDDSVLKAYLSSRLPEYMIPSVFVHLEKFPLTANGKVDRNALPAPDFCVDERLYVAPKTALEATLCNIWQEILGLERVGVLDDFFRIGGDSILSIQLTSRLQQKNLHCSVRDIFEHRCIERLATCLEQAVEKNNSNDLEAELAFVSDEFCLAKISSLLLDSLQERYEIAAIYSVNSLQRLFIHNVLNRTDHDDPYQGQFLFEYDCPIDLDCYQQAWSLAIQKYPALRMCFNWDEEMIQIVCKQGHLDFTVHDICAEKDKESAIERIKTRDLLDPFDLARPTLLRLHLIKHNDMDYTLIQVIHHLVTDGWSSAVLLNQVHDYYYQLTHQRVPQINEDKAYGHAQAYIAKYQSGAHQYWVTEFDTIRPVNGLVDDKPASGKVSKLLLEVKGEHYVALKALIKREGITFNVLVQYAWHKLIHEQTRASQTIVATTLSGRMLPVPDVTDSVGCYINAVPMILDWHHDATLEMQLRQIHRKITEINEHGFADLMALHTLKKADFCSEILFQNFPGSADMDHQQGRLHAVPRVTNEGNIDTPLVLVAVVLDDVLHLCFKWDEAYLKDAEAQQLLLQFHSILEELQ